MLCPKHQIERRDGGDENGGGNDELFIGDTEFVYEDADADARSDANSGDADEHYGPTDHNPQTCELMSEHFCLLCWVCRRMIPFLPREWHFPQARKEARDILANFSYYSQGGEIEIR